MLFLPLIVTMPSIPFQLPFFRILGKRYSIILHAHVYENFNILRKASYLKWDLLEVEI